MCFNYDRLLERVFEVFRDKRVFAIKMQMAESVLISRIENKTQFRKEEIDRAVILLGIEHKNISEYFFAIENDKKRSN
ncbi:DUF739 family protein [Eubacterium maltosivorans]|uniref:DUF739 domain-containing protein n=1 Tax=Eubacterium maltosivorans TaxID=2041044 RepID=A0A4P9CBW0_EUBML|nr:DUF739 family protein [Eubacterium maltosivorans]QCT72341.1 DUF739 domain-containing protein [Eubacterium maltosivorans]